MLGSWRKKKKYYEALVKEPNTKAKLLRNKLLSLIYDCDLVVV